MNASVLEESSVTTPLHVMVVEDDELLRDQVIAPKLRQHGFGVAAISHGEALEEQLQHQRPDIVLLGAGQPGHDGFEVTRQMRAHAADIGIVMLTGRSTTPDRVRALNEGADAFLSKPVDLDVLVSTLFSLARRLRLAGRSCLHWRLDAAGWCLVAPSGREVALTKTERRLLELFFGKPNQIISREAVIAHLTANVHDFDTHRIDSLLHRLRKKVTRITGLSLPVSSVHGEGYVLIRR